MDMGDKGRESKVRIKGYVTESEGHTGIQLRVCNRKIMFFISQPKHMLWVLKRTVSMRQFF